MEREELMEELIDCVLNDENSDEMISAIREVFNSAEKAEVYEKALKEIADRPYYTRGSLVDTAKRALEKIKSIKV